MKNNAFYALKKQCMKSNLVLNFDTEKKIYSINIFGRSGILFTSLTLSPVGGFLKRYKDNKAKEDLDKEKRFEAYVQSFYDDAGCGR